MTTLYCVLVGAIFASLVVLLGDALRAVSRGQAWVMPQLGARLVAVETVDRRSAGLPFVGAERRAAVELAKVAEATESGARLVA